MDHALLRPAWRRFRLPDVLLLALLMASSGCEHKSPSAPQASAPRELPEIQASVLAIEPRSWPRRITVQGSLIADDVAVVGAKVAGRVARVQVDLGDHVAAGHPLVALEQQEFQLRVQQAAAELAQARAAVGLAEGMPLESLDPKNSPPVREQQAAWDEARTRAQRMQQLYEQKAVTDNDLDTAVAAAEVAAARYASALNAVNEKLAQIGVRAAALSLAQQQLADATVTAGFEGLVQERHVAPGSFVQVGQALVTLVRADPLRFRGTLPERYAQELTLGQEVRLRIDSTRAPRTVTITRISPALDPLNRSLTFEAEVENADGALRAGLFGEAEVVLDPDARAIAVPVGSIVEFAGTEKVWKVVEGKSQEQIVQTGERRDGYVAVSAGVQAGDMILLDGKAGRVAKVVPAAIPPADNSEHTIAGAPPAPADEPLRQSVDVPQTGTASPPANAE